MDLSARKQRGNARQNEQCEGQRKHGMTKSEPPFHRAEDAREDAIAIMRPLAVTTALR